MKNNTHEFHSCYDELLSKLFLMTYENAMNLKEAIDDEGETSVSLISNEPQAIDRVTKDNTCYFTNNYNTSTLYNNIYDLTAHEIIIYSILLHKCIEEQSEECTISYKEIQQLRGKRIGKSKLLDNTTMNAYDKAFSGLCEKYIKYNLGTSRQKYKITYRKHSHPLLIINDIQQLCNGDMFINYSLGPFGKTLIESKRYSNLVPKQYFQINFNEVMVYQIALYICRIIYINRKKSKPITITLNSIMKNISKFMNTEKYGLVKYCCALYYGGPNVKRLWDSVIIKVAELLETLKKELKINSYHGNYEIIKNSLYLEKDQYKEVKWIIYLNN